MHTVYRIQLYRHQHLNSFRFVTFPLLLIRSENIFREHARTFGVTLIGTLHYKAESWENMSCLSWSSKMRRSHLLTIKSEDKKQDSTPPRWIAFGIGSATQLLEKNLKCDIFCHRRYFRGVFLALAIPFLVTNLCKSFAVLVEVLTLSFTQTL